jgi:hypothetical protein
MVKKGALLGGIAALLLAACGQGSDASSETAPAGSTDAPGLTSVRPCHSGQLDAELVSAGSTMSQPFVSVKLRNRGANACGLAGYADLKAVGHVRGHPDQHLRLDVRHGSIYERADSTARTLVLHGDVIALFDVSTGTAYPGPPQHLVITRLLISVPGSGAALPLHVRLPASHPPHRPIPIRTTAFTPFVESSS